MKSKLNQSIKFSLTIAVITFVLAAIFSVIASSLLASVTWIVGLIIVFFIVFVGIFSDMLGVASTAAKEPPLNAMAAEKVYGAKEAVIIVKNADKFSSFANDVIGDISGIISGTATVVVVLNLSKIIGEGEGSSTELFFSVLLTSIVASVTVGGKALGKFFAIHSNITIIMFTGKLIAFIQDKLKIRVLPKSNKDKKRANNKKTKSKGK